MAVNVIKRSWKVDRLVRPETLNGMTFQAESGGHRFEITGYDANGSMIAFGGTVTAVFLRPDNTDVALTGVLSNGIAQVTLTEECYQVPGRFGLAVFVNQNNTKTVVYDCIGTVARTSSGVAATSVVEDVSTLIDRIDAAVNSIPQDYSALSKAVGNITCPELRNGSTGNPWNTDSVTTKYIIKLDKTCDDLILEYIGNTSAAQYIFGYSIFKGVADGTESYEARSTAQSYADFPEQYVQTEPYVIIPMSQFGDYTHIAIVLWARSDDTTYIPLRIATEQYNLRVTFRHASYMGHEDINNRSVKVGVLNAAKMSSPLKLIHFSDLHKDINALNRIKASIEYVCPNADNIICTGDMVANTYAEITSWWDPAIMTVIGNHDTASWDGSSYDWTALSMAQRDEMYISPFKSYWGITHTSGTSYYYKDYSTAHIRLIVMDAMLYSGTPGAEATAQTSWLAGLLSDAISNNLHVLIAIHAPHGGSVPVACNFTKLGQETMPVNVDCNTPDAVINTVATAINAGLHFIGYICGHTHQDAIWDATGDGTQLMYCITCAAVDQTAQWINSDQYRTDEQDAFNVLTIDTASTTIKILRGGGANTDGALRPRVSLVIDYSTGKIITDTYASGTQDAVVYGEAQTLTDAEKAQARTNIGAGSAADVSENTADITANANEITSLKSAIDRIASLEIDNIPFTIDGTGYIAFADGTVATSSVSSHTSYVDVSQYTEIKYKRQCLESSSASAGTAFYDADKNYISGISSKLLQPSAGYTEEIVSVPQNAVYARFSTYTNTTTYGVFSASGKREIVDTIERLSESVESVNDDVADIDGRIFEDAPLFTNISDIPNIVTKTGYNASNGSSTIQMAPNSSYDSYWFVLDKDVDIWVGTLSASYFAIVVGNGEYVGTLETSSGYYVYCTDGSTRYNTIYNNLPTVNNKLHIQAGRPLAFTISAGKMDGVYGLETAKVVKQSFKNEIISGIEAQREKYLRYISGSGADSSTERVEIYIPSVSGYVRYDFVHTVKASINADVWRIGYATHTNDSLIEDFAITTEGEWECAVKLSGRNDFSGGFEHGDEVFNNILFIVDGRPTDITTLSNLTKFENLSIIEDSTMYDPNDSTTAFANHGSEHIFTNDGMIIKQSIAFTLPETVVTLYMAMLPIAKAVSNMVVPNNDFVPLSTETARRLYNTDAAVIYKTDGNVKADFSVTRFEYLTENDYTFLCLDNNSPHYNKCYFCNTLSSVSVNSGKKLKSETIYKFTVGE